MLKMPVLYNSDDHVKFIHVVKNFQYWWNRISYAPFDSVYLRGGGANHQYAC